MIAGIRCLELVKKAIVAIHQAQEQSRGAACNDFDRLAFNNAAEYLDRALEELLYFDECQADGFTSGKKRN